MMWMATWIVICLAYVAYVGYVVWQLKNATAYSIPQKMVQTALCVVIPIAGVVAVHWFLHVDGAIEKELPSRKSTNKPDISDGDIFPGGRD